MVENNPICGGYYGLYPPQERRTRRDSNPQPADSKSDALSVELRVRGENYYTPGLYLVNSEQVIPGRLKSPRFMGVRVTKKHCRLTCDQGNVVVE